MQTLAITFIVGEEKGLFLSNRPARRCAELISSKTRRRTHIEEIGGVECIVAKEFKSRPVPLIGARLGYDRHLPAGMFAVFGRVCVPQYVELANGVHTQQLLAGS